MRDVTERRYRAVVVDGDERHVFFYRRPSNKEIAAYQAGLFERRGNKIVPKAAETRTKFGAPILLGFEKGTLGAHGKLISSDPKDPDFLPNWKELLIEFVPDIVAAIGRNAFEATTVVSDTGATQLEIGDLELEDEETMIAQAMGESESNEDAIGEVGSIDQANPPIEETVTDSSIK